MMSAHALHLGPIMLPWPLLIALASILLSFMLLRWLRAYFKVDLSAWQALKDSVWTAIWLGLLVARLAFVLAHSAFYLEHPIEIVMIQDKGFNLLWGTLAAALWIIYKNRQHALAMSISLVLSIVVLYNLGHAALSQWQQQYQQYPQVELSTLTQRTVQLNQYIGKPMVINLWASWCPPCHREMPVLMQAQSRYPDVQFVMINQGEDALKVTQYLAQNHLSFEHVLLDPEGQTATATGMFGLPSTLFYNARGELVESHMGEISTTVLQQKIAKLEAQPVSLAATP